MGLGGKSFVAQYLCSVNSCSTGCQIQSVSTGLGFSLFADVISTQPGNLKMRRHRIEFSKKSGDGDGLCNSALKSGKKDTEQQMADRGGQSGPSVFCLSDHSQSPDYSNKM